MPVHLPDRLVATVAATWADRLEDVDDAVDRVLPQLHAALYGRVVTTIRTWLGEADVDIDLHVVGEGEQPQLVRRDGRIRAELPFAWLVTVWARGLGTIWGRFCLDATTADGDRWTLAMLGPELGEPRPMTIELPAG